MPKIFTSTRIAALSVPRGDAESACLVLLVTVLLIDEVEQGLAGQIEAQIPGK
jgi:hypothetical protein